MRLLSEMKAKRRRGFTLVELLVVIVVLAVLAAIVLPKFMDSSARSKESSLRTDLKLIRNVISAFQADTAKYPHSLDDLAKTDETKVKVADGSYVVANDWHGPYLEAVPNDSISGSAFNYDKTTSKVASSATGNGLDGTAYSTW